MTKWLEDAWRDAGFAIRQFRRTPGHRLVVRMVVWQALAHAGTGILLGVPAAFVAVNLIRNRLYEVNPADPTNAGVAAVLLIACLALAGYLPARRAARIDPVRTLRQE